VTNFDAAFALVVDAEGNYVNDPDDPGGATKFGISQRSYPALDIASLTLEDAKAIYQRDFWNRLGLDNDPWPVALLTFDAAVNQGPSFAASLPATDPKEIAVERALRYGNNANFTRYGKGWLERLFTMYTAAMGAPPT